jgi:hypothetical protein
VADQFGCRVVLGVLDRLIGHFRETPLEVSRDHGKFSLQLLVVDLGHRPVFLLAVPRACAPAPRLTATTVRQPVPDGWETLKSTPNGSYVKP